MYWHPKKTNSTWQCHSLDQLSSVQFSSPFRHLCDRGGYQSHDPRHSDVSCDDPKYSGELVGELPRSWQLPSRSTQWWLYYCWGGGLVMMKPFWIPRFDEVFRDMVWAERMRLIGLICLQLNWMEPLPVWYLMFGCVCVWVGGRVTQSER